MQTEIIELIPLDAKERASSISFRVPTIDPLIVMRFSTISNIEQGKSPMIKKMKKAQS